MLRTRPSGDAAAGGASLIGGQGELESPPDPCLPHRPWADCIYSQALPVAPADTAGNLGMNEGMDSESFQKFLRITTMPTPSRVTLPNCCIWACTEACPHPHGHLETHTGGDKVSSPLEIILTVKGAPGQMVRCK